MSPAKSTNSLSNARIKHFAIGELLGVGGMGEVYLAEDTHLERKIAIKFLAKKFSRSKSRLARFIREAKAASALNHPNIITIYEIGEFEGKHFIATELIEGETLHSRLRGTQLPINTAMEITAQIASALKAAHRAGIVHRDIKPENVMLRPDGLVKVLDFGIAKLIEKQTLDSETGTASSKASELMTQAGVIMGTPQYMSPEQSRGLSVDERTDIWSLGIVLYQMLTGELPFQGDTLSDVIAAVLEREVPPLDRALKDYPLGIEEIIKKALRKDLSERYQEIGEFAEQLDHLNRQVEFEIELEKSKHLNTAKTIEMHHAAGADSVEFPAESRVDKDKLLITEFTNLTGDPVFDGTLKTGLAVSLEQSPFLDIFPDARVSNTLRLMERSPDETVTPALGREICLRNGLKAYITGTISMFGSVYVLTLEAVNARTGENIARKLEQAESKEQVLKVLGTAAAGLREKLGESLSSIGQMDAQPEYTTVSLDALKIYSLGVHEQRRGNWLAAISFYQQAIELDPNFSSAYVGASSSYSNTNQPKLAAEYAAKAFELRDGVSEIEKLRISHFYYAYATGELDKRIETLEVMRRIYPRVKTTLNNLSDCYMQLGQFEKAIIAIRKSLEESPHSAVSYDNLAMSLLAVDDLQGSRETCEEAIASGLENIYFHVCLYLIAFIENDESAMTQHLNWIKEQPEEYMALHIQAGSAAFCGRMREAREFSRRASERANLSEVKGAAGIYAAKQAVREALLTLDEEIEKGALNSQVRVLTQRALEYERNPAVFPRAVFALAFGGFADDAERLIEEMLAEFPKDTLVKNLWLPVIRATIDLRGGRAAEALGSLDLVRRFEPAAEFYPQYVRALALKKLGKKAEAAEEFEKILAHRGEAPLSLKYPMARLGLADNLESKAEYENFFALWNEADEDLPVLLRARKEFAKKFGDKK